MTPTPTTPFFHPRWPRWSEQRCPLPLCAPCVPRATWTAASPQYTALHVCWTAVVAQAQQGDDAASAVCAPPSHDWPPTSLLGAGAYFRGNECHLFEWRSWRGIDSRSREGPTWNMSGRIVTGSEAGTWRSHKASWKQRHPWPWPRTRREHCAVRLACNTWSLGTESGEFQSRLQRHRGGVFQCRPPDDASRQ